MSRVVYGTHPVEALLARRPQAVHCVFVEASRSGSQDPVGALVEQARAKGLTIIAHTREQLDSLCASTSHQGVAAVTGDFSYCDLYELVDETAGTPLIVAVDGVTDPQNLGAMVRACVALGASGMVLTTDRCAAITPTVVRISSGATEQLRCAMVTNLARSLRELKDHGLWVAGAVEAGGMAPAKADLRQPTALVLGNEQKGIRHGVRQCCDLLLTIPTAKHFRALNVASATGVLLYEAARQRTT